MKANGFFINLLTLDIEGTKKYYEFLDFEVIKAYTNKDTVAYKVADHGYMMFLTKPMMEIFFEKEINHQGLENQIVSFVVNSMKQMYLLEDKLKHKQIKFKVYDDDVMYFIHFKDNNGYLLEFVFEKV